MISVVVVAVLLSLARAAAVPVEDNPYVQVLTRAGAVKGIRQSVSEDLNVETFFGIPYAQPPVGNLRFSKPVGIKPWTGVRDATKYGNQCMQSNTATWNSAPASEDCLYINIYSPKPKDRTRGSPLLPVMFWVHGGNFRDQSSIYFNYTKLAMKGVVVVTTNYRLDALGYLSTQDSVIPGNFGLQDAAMSLNFVKRIIDAFGGNPMQITLFGSSAGSAMVTQMALSPMTRGKFQRAIMSSGPGSAFWSSHRGPPVYTARQVAANLGKRLGCALPADLNLWNEQDSQGLLDCLRQVPPETLQAEVATMTAQDYFGTMIFIPVTGDPDGFLPKHPSELAADTQSMTPISAMFGWTTHDAAWTAYDPENDGIDYATFTGELAYTLSIYYPQDPGMYQRLLNLYGASDPTKLSPIDVRSIAVKQRTDSAFESPIVKEARQFSRAASKSVFGKKVFVYQYDYRPSYNSGNPEWWGVVHMDDRGMIMGLPNGTNTFTYPSTNDDDRKVADMMTTMWSNFAKCEDPTPQPLADGTKWPAFGHTVGDQDILVIRPQPEVKQYTRDAFVELWTGDTGLDAAEPGC